MLAHYINVTETSDVKDGTDNETAESDIQQKRRKT